MTRAEWQRLNRWLKSDTIQAWLCAWVVGLVAGGLVSGLIGDVTNSVLTGLILGSVTVSWPLLALALNFAVLAVRSRTNRNLRFERKCKELDAREQRIAALERATAE